MESKYGIAAEKYRQCMEEVKRRTEVINAFLTGRCNALYVQSTAETVCLQIRKILELIALASLAANHREFSRRRRDFHKMWHGGRILHDLKQINPDFYPQPSEQVLDDAGKVIRVDEIKTGFLSEADYKTLYNKCGATLHATNPFSRSDQDIQAFLKQVPEWMEKIRALLQHHHIQLSDPDLQFWVIMRAKSDGRVHVSEFKRVDGH